MQGCKIKIDFLIKSSESICMDVQCHNLKMLKCTDSGEILFAMEEAARWQEASFILLNPCFTIDEKDGAVRRMPVVVI